MPSVFIPGKGKVFFPDTMTPEQIAAAIGQINGSGGGAGAAAAAKAAPSAASPAKEPSIVKRGIDALVSPVPALQSAAAAAASKVEGIPRPASTSAGLKGQVKDTVSGIREDLKSGPVTRINKLGNRALATVAGLSGIPSVLEAIKDVASLQLSPPESSAYSPQARIAQGLPAEPTFLERLKDRMRINAAAGRGMVSGIIQGIGDLSPAEILLLAKGAKDAAVGGKVELPPRPSAPGTTPRRLTLDKIPANIRDLVAEPITEAQIDRSGRADRPQTFDAAVNQGLADAGVRTPQQSVELPPSEPAAMPRTGGRESGSPGRTIPEPGGALGLGTDSAAAARGSARRNRPSADAVRRGQDRIDAAFGDNQGAKAQFYDHLMNGRDADAIALFRQHVNATNDAIINNLAEETKVPKSPEDGSPEAVSRSRFIKQGGTEPKIPLPTTTGDTTVKPARVTTAEERAAFAASQRNAAGTAGTAPAAATPEPSGGQAAVPAQAAPAPTSAPATGISLKDSMALDKLRDRTISALKRAKLTGSLSTWRNRFVYLAGQDSLTPEQLKEFGQLEARIRNHPDLPKNIKKAMDKLNGAPQATVKPASDTVAETPRAPITERAQELATKISPPEAPPAVPTPEQTAAVQDAVLHDLRPPTVSEAEVIQATPGGIAPVASRGPAAGPSSNLGESIRRSLPEGVALAEKLQREATVQGLTEQPLHPELAAALEAFGKEGEAPVPKVGTGAIDVNGNTSGPSISARVGVRPPPRGSINLANTARRVPGAEGLTIEGTSKMMSQAPQVRAAREALTKFNSTNRPAPKVEAGPAAATSLEDLTSAARAGNGAVEAPVRKLTAMEIKAQKAAEAKKAAAQRAAGMIDLSEQRGRQMQELAKGAPPGVEPVQWESLQATEAQARDLIEKHGIKDPRLINDMRTYYGARETGQRLGISADEVRKITGRPFSRRPMKEVLREMDERYRLLRDDPSGFTRTELLAAGAGAAGAMLVAGPMLNGEDPLDQFAYTLAAGLIGGGLSYSGVRAVQNFNWKTAGAKAEALDTAKLLAGPAMIKASFGGIGGIAAGFWQRVSEGNMGLARAGLKAAWTEMPRLWWRTLTGPLPSSRGAAGAYSQHVAQAAGATGLPGRVLNQIMRPFYASDVAGKYVMKKMGFSEAEADRLMLMGEPTSVDGQRMVQLISNNMIYRNVAKFPRVRIQTLERGLEFTPGLSKLTAEGVRPTARPNNAIFTPQEGLTEAARRARAQFGGALMVTGSAYGYWRDPGLKESSFIAAMAGPAALPFAMGTAAGKALLHGKSPLTEAAVQAISSIPQVNEADIRNIVNGKRLTNFPIVTALNDLFGGQ